MPTNENINPNKIVGINTIKTYLPHRYPFLLIDRVINYEEGKWITAIKNVTGNEEFFLGHFPEQPIMPGVLIIEALAQASGMLYFLTKKDTPEATDRHYLAGIDDARFKKVVQPGDQLTLHSEMRGNRLDLWLFDVKATVDGQLACSAKLKVLKGVFQK